SDIALIKIKSNNDLITKAKSASISTASISTGQTVITAGWGQTTNDDTAQSNSLMYAGLMVANDDDCRAAAVDWNGQNGRYVCTSYSTAPGIGTCFGDSGGPLLLSTGGGYTLLGIVSFDVNTKDSSNTRCAQDGNISYFTRVSSYLSFITSTTGISEAVLTGASSPWSHNAASVSTSSSSSSDSSSSDSSSSSSSGSDDDKDKDKDNKDKNNDDDKDKDNDDKDKDNDDKDKDNDDKNSSSDSGSTDNDGKSTDKSSTIDDEPTGSTATDESDEVEEHVDGDKKDKSSADKKHDDDDDSESDSTKSAASDLSVAKTTSVAFAALAIFLTLF
ncbi:hypothetical protein IWW50_002288, partial [Coemansia erecta]